MTVERLPPPPRTRTQAGDALLDGIPAGLSAAVVLVVGSLVRDRIAGDASGTLTRVGARLLREPGALEPVVAASARSATTGVAFVLVECMVLGAVVAWLLPRLRRAPTAGVTFTVAFAALLLAFYALDRASGVDFLARLRPWVVLAGHALAAGTMTLTLWARRPRILEGRREIREDEP